MLVEKGLGKLEKFLGGDALESRWYEAPVYEFVLEKECSNKTVVGHGWNRSEGDVVVYELTDSGWARATVYPMTADDMAMKAVIGSHSGFNDVEKVAGVVDVQENQIGQTEWDITVDVADGVIVDVERTEKRD
jgi:hypothetical protein